MKWPFQIAGAGDHGFGRAQKPLSPHNPTSRTYWLWGLSGRLAHVKPWVVLSGGQAARCVVSHVSRSRHLGPTQLLCTDLLPTTRDWEARWYTPVPLSTC